jgi:hypothetical protein
MSPSGKHRDPTSSPTPAAPTRSSAGRRCLLPLLLCLLPGCAQLDAFRQSNVASYEPSNVHRAEPFLPAQMKRVAVLPVTTLTDGSIMEFGRDSLGPVLLHELGRARLFELVAVSPEDLLAMTGRAEWSGEEQLPADFFEKLKEKLGVDAVLFSRLTQYRAYEPLSVGWRLKLLDAEEPRVVWAVDEVFDARVPEVVAGARRFARHHRESAAAPAEPDDILSSPRRFGQYAASALVATLPGRATGASPP